MSVLRKLRLPAAIAILTILLQWARAFPCYPLAEGGKITFKANGQIDFFG